MSLETTTEESRRSLINRCNKVLRDQIPEFGEVLCHFPSFANDFLAIAAQTPSIGCSSYYEELLTSAFKPKEQPYELLIRTIVGIKEFKGEDVNLGGYINHICLGGNTELILI